MPAKAAEAAGAGDEAVGCIEGAVPGVTVAATGWEGRRTCSARTQEACRPRQTTESPGRVAISAAALSWTKNAYCKEGATQIMQCEFQAVDVYNGACVASVDPSIQSFASRKAT
mmetsp:Transcript_7471/g.14152  ORF Transcript_7471/g.14152 Transcript_7471/m.14152 type:complete len:114 (-) Transcript_7471:949-1290(-)